MKAIFEVMTIETDWKPPFKKNIYNKEYEAKEQEGFDRIKGNGNDEDAFIVEKISHNKTLIKYSRLITLKDPTKAKLEKERRIWLDIGENQQFTYLWGEKGITKTLTYKAITTKDEEEEAKKEIAEQLINQNQEN
ncbi:MAG: hypothetical protein QXZ13_00450 [Candidatus Diapherotrites archaeon]